MKNSLRKCWKTERKNIPINRKIEAQNEAYSSLLILLASFNHILSFAPFSTEIDLWRLNHYLADEQKLYLPKVANNHRLDIYQIKKIESELSTSHLDILEPNSLSSPVDPQNIDCILVPALAFDCTYMRLGYGKGYYDRLIALFRDQCKIIGIGYKEQLSKTPLPIEEHDQRLDQLYLF